MKILRRNDDFRKMPEKSLEDVLAVKSLINQGWNYCAKQVYKEFFNGKKVKETLTEECVEPAKVKKSDKKKAEKK